MSFSELDKMCGIVIRIRKEDGAKSTNKLIAMLEDLLSTKDKELKKQIMVNEYGMVMTEELERSVDDMCNLSTVVEEKGKAEGSLETLISLVKKGILAIEEAAEELGVTVEEFQKKMATF